MRRNKIISLLLVGIMMLGLCSCQKADVGVTYNVNTGDKITVYCNDKELDFRPSLPFSILDGKTTLAQGNFITIEQYNEYISSLAGAGEMVTIYQEETHKNNTMYIFYSTQGTEGMEYNYIIKIKDSKTALVFGSKISKEAAEQAFNAMQFTVQK